VVAACQESSGCSPEVEAVVAVVAGIRPDLFERRCVSPRGSDCPLHTCTAGTRYHTVAAPRHRNTERRRAHRRSQTEGHRRPRRRPPGRDCRPAAGVGDAASSHLGSVTRPRPIRATRRPSARSRIRTCRSRPAGGTDGRDDGVAATSRQRRTSSIRAHRQGSRSPLPDSQRRIRGRGALLPRLFRLNS
jgi:hypothetical protein